MTSAGVVGPPVWGHVLVWWGLLLNRTPFIVDAYQDGNTLMLMVLHCQVDGTLACLVLDIGTSASQEEEGKDLLLALCCCNEECRGAVLIQQQTKP